jgi:hypothetical protein
MNTPEPTQELEPGQAEYLVRLQDGATVLCEAHMNAVRLACEAAQVDLDIFQLPWDDEPIRCQACHLAAVTRPQIILPN